MDPEPYAIVFDYHQKGATGFKLPVLPYETVEAIGPGKYDCDTGYDG